MPRIPLAVDLHINKFYGATISDYDRGITNGVIEKVGNRLYVTQRPSIDIFEDASSASESINASDTFTDVDGTIARDHTSEGAAWTDQQAGNSSAAKIYNNRLVGVANELNHYDANAVPLSPDYTVSADIYVASKQGNIGIAVRHSTSSESYYGVVTDGSTWTLFKNGGYFASDILATYSQSLTVGSTYQINIQVSGSTIEAWIGASKPATPELSATDSSISSEGFPAVIKAAYSPSITASTADTSTTGFHIDNFKLKESDARGRGIYYWDENSALYFVNNDTVYKNSHSTAIGTISAGTKKCYFMSLNSLLLLVDPENDQAWTISTSGVLTEITDVDFPPKQTPAVGLAYGGAVLDGYFFVLGENGIVYNSDLEAPATWNGTNFIDAERDPDGGAYLGKHHDHIVVYGVRTMEFFYDAANINGSPLSRRQDVAYNIGCADGGSVWEEGDRSFFVGSAYSGALGVYLLEQFQVKKVSTSTIDSFISQAIVKDGYSVVGSGFTAQGHTFYILTLYTTPSSMLPAITLVYDYTAGTWHQWDTTIGGQSHFPLVGWSIRTGVLPRYGEGIFSNGDLITINDDLSPVDTILESTYVAAGYVDAGYVAGGGTTNSQIQLTVRAGQYDGGTDKIKFMHELKQIADETDNAQTLTVKWSDEKSNAMNTGKTLDTSKYRKLRRLGSFRRRNFQLEYSGSDVVRIEALEFTLDTGAK